MTAPPIRWTDVKAVFEATADRPPTEREPLIAVAALDTASLAELRSLLAHHDAANGTPGFLAEPAAPASPAVAARTGQRLGAWEIVRPLGAGGMGEVYEVRRADGRFDGRAAVKLLKRGMDSAAVLQRFAQERQALARLNHPHIARLFDAGASDDGLPYFVLEYVDGRPIDQAARALPLEARLALFLQLADAVAHAHRRLLVHRDLKPGNVLVDTDGQVKLLDFGIAKALDPAESGDGGITLGGVRPFTPLYASPEQVRGEPVTTATDIYSLGVLLYQMLTGLRPTGRHATTPAEAARSVLEEAPTRPSRLSPEAGVDAQWLHTRKRLEGDLDNILLKALDKRIEHRYASVDALIADVRAHLAGFPVSARPPYAGYLLAKFVARHRVASAAVALGVLGLGLGLGASLWQGQKAAAARDQAQARLTQIRDITHDVVLRYGDAMTFLPGGLAVKEDLLKDLIVNLDRLAVEMGDDPEWQADLTGAYARLAELQGNDTGVSLKKLPDAGRNAARAIALAERAWPAKQGDARFVEAYLRALQIQAQTQRAAGQPADGVLTLRRALGLADQVLPRFLPEQRRPVALRRAALTLALAMFTDQQSVASLNQPEQALALLADAQAQLAALDLAQADRLSGDLLGMLHGSRAISYGRLGQLEAARLDAQAAIRYRERAVAQEPADVVAGDGLVTEATNGGVILLRLGDAPGALAATRVAWAQVQTLARENGAGNKWLDIRPRVAQHHGRALLANGQFDEAAQVLPEAVAMWQARLAEQPAAPAAAPAAAVHARRMLAWMNLQLAQAHWGQGQRVAASVLAQRQVGELETLAAAPKAGDAMLNLGEACLFMARAQPAARAAWLQRSRLAYERAATLRPLNGDHLVNYRAAGGKA